jgi:hypothetical protein
MIGFTGTTLQLELMITAHTLNSFLTTSDESLTNLGLVSTTLEFTNALPFISTTRLG